LAGIPEIFTGDQMPDVRGIVLRVIGKNVTVSSQ
jgi:hypothetical protein